MKHRIPQIAAALVGMAATAHAVSPQSDDLLLLKDGRIVSDRPISRDGEFAVVTYENGEVRVPMDMVESLVKPGEDWLPESEEERKQYEDGKVLFEGRYVPIKTRDREVDKRLKAERERIEEDRQHSYWGKRREDESKNFMWAYTVPEHIKEGFVARCESYYTQFCKDWKVKRDPRKPKMYMNFYNDAGEFRKVGGAGGGALAYFMFLGNYDLNAYYDRLDPEFTEMVLYHELSHYLQKLINEDFKVPHWPGEGVAEYYGGALWNAKAKKLDIGLIQDGRLAEVKNDIALGNYMSLRKTVTVDQYEDYNWGWTLVHFFMNTKYKKGFQKYMKGIANDKNVKRVPGPFGLKTVSPEESLRYLMECLKVKGDDGIDKLEKEWHDYVDNELQLSGVKGLENAASGALSLGKRIQAKRLFQEAIDAGSRNPSTFLKYAQLIRNKDRDRAIELLRRATELDPITAQYHYELGKTLKRSGEKEEGEKLIALAKEMNEEVDKNDFDFSEVSDD